MGAAFWPVFDKNVPDNGFCDEGKVLIREVEQLDDLADAIGVSRLSSFADNRSIPDNLDGDPEDLEELIGPFADWFRASEGVRVIAGLLEMLDKRPEMAWERYDCETVAGALRMLGERLNLADEVGAKFRLEVYS